jgi:hypothetical protein
VTEVRIPEGLAAGPYFIVAIANAGLARDEDFGNNVRVRRIQIASDLSIFRLTVTVTSAGLSIYDETFNAINGPTPATVTGFYVNTAPTLAGAERIGERAIPAFTGRGRNRARPPAGPTVIPVPAGLTAGTAYYVVAKADDGNIVSETDETNNTLAAPFQALPDLVVQRLAAVPRTGIPLALRNVVLNKGAAPSAATTIRLSFASGPACDEGVQELATRDVGALDRGAIDRTDTPVDLVSLGLGSGTYCLIAEVDPGNGVAEIQEGNNRVQIFFTVP